MEANNVIESFWRLKKKDNEKEAVPAMPVAPAKVLEEERPVTAIDLGEKDGKESISAEGLESKAKSECISTLCYSERSC
jgi:hypothetical protein